MTRTRNAGFVYGAPLPACFIPANAACDNGDDGGADQAGENGTAGDGQGEGPSDGAGGSSADDAGTGGGDADEWDDDEEVQSVPKLKKLHEEAKRWRHRVRELEAAAAEQPDPGHDLRIEAAFYRHAARDVIDLDAALKLADLSGVTISDDGKVTGMADAVAEVCRQYPFLADDPDAWDDDPRTRTTEVPQASGSGGSPSSGRRPGAGRRSSTPKALLEKFPALADRRH